MMFLFPFFSCVPITPLLRMFTFSCVRLTPAVSMVFTFPCALRLTITATFPLVSMFRFFLFFRGRFVPVFWFVIGVVLSLPLDLEALRFLIDALLRVRVPLLNSTWMWDNEIVDVMNIVLDQFKLITYCGTWIMNE